MTYLILKNLVLGPILHVLFRPWMRGAEHIPKRGAAVIASNHLSFVDSIFLPLKSSQADHLFGQERLLHRQGPKGNADQVVFQGNWTALD